jgi:hypothetical protein
LILIAIPRVSAQEWRKIVPLKSTCADVERLLGANDKSYGVDYELTDGVVSMSTPVDHAEKKGKAAGMVQKASL